MIQSKLLNSLLAILICLSSMQIFAQTAPTEKNSAQIKRSATSSNPMIESLSKNLFKTEEYQAPYTVQVPYQDTETYTVDVPYQVDETYTVQVPYQDTETYTENVPYTVSVPYTDYETDYRQEYRCNPVTRYREECHNERNCYLVPGTGGGGGQQCRQVEECGVNAQGQRICKTRTVCDGNGGGATPPEQRCEDKNVCTNVPYTDQNCGYEQVPYTKEVTRYRDETRYRQETRTRTVTRYREETRTRTVTKTRTETRTREVTKYRDEERCCVTKTRQVFDRQLSYNVSLMFPQDALLAGTETETIQINLVSADANTAQVSIQVLNSVYGYKIAKQSASGGAIQVELAFGPKFDLSNAGATTIQGLRIDYLAADRKFQVSFADTFVSSHVQSTYEIVVNDLVSGAVIENLQVSRLANSKLGAVLQTNLDSQAKIKATLKVKRTGALIADGGLSFETSASFEKRSVQKDDLASLTDPKNLGGQIFGSDLNASFQLIDQTPEFSDLNTQYVVYLTLKTLDGGNQPLQTTKISRENLKLQGMTIKLSPLFKSLPEALKNLHKGRIIKFTIQALRKGQDNGILFGKSVTADQSGRITIQ